MIPFAHTSFHFHEDNIQWFISNNLHRVWLRCIVVSLGSVRQKWDTQCWKLISVTWNQDGFGHDHSWRQECWLSSRSITQPHQLWIRSLLSLLGVLPQLRGRNPLFSGREPRPGTWKLYKVRLGGADSHSSCFTFNCKIPAEGHTQIKPTEPHHLKYSSGVPKT